MSRRDRFFTTLTVMLCLVFVAVTADKPPWRIVIVAAPLVGAVGWVVRRLRARFGPGKKPEQETFDKVFLRSEGGAVAWKGEDPQAGSPLDDTARPVRTASDYLRAEEPAPIRVLVLGAEGALAEQRAFEEELARWLGEATGELLEGLVPAARAMGARMNDTVLRRLMEAREARGIPTLEALTALAEELDNAELREWVAEERAEETC